MQNQALKRQLQALEALLKSTTEASQSNLELQGHWARYLCILVAGFLENALVEVYSDYTTKTSAPSVAKFTITALSRIQNPNATRFVETARAFNDQWATDLSIFLDQNGRRDAVDGIMANRHLIAHGRTSGISVVRVQDYLKKCVEVVAFIEGQCL
jgi:hypothetical protein